MIKLVVLVIVAGMAGAGWLSGIGRSTTTPSSPPVSAIAQPDPGDQTIQITEADLNQRLSQKLVGRPLGSTPLGTATLERITTSLTNGHVVANGDAQVASNSVPLSLTASGTVQNGRPLVVVDDLRAAGVSLPTSTKQSVEQVLQAQLDDVVNQQQLRISSMTIANGKLTLTGTRL